MLDRGEYVIRSDGANCEPTHRRSAWRDDIGRIEGLSTIGDSLTLAYRFEDICGKLTELACKPELFPGTVDPFGR